jgi:hypothetical protein
MTAQTAGAVKMDDNYKGHKITLRSGQQDDGKWTCQFVVFKFDKTDMGKRSGYTDRSFGSHQEAEASALIKAKALIDSN